MVIGTRLTTMSRTGWRNMSEVPIWPCTSPETKSQYCSGNERFNPSCSRSAAMLCAVARSPSRTVAGSPGRKCTMPKTTIVTPNSTKIDRNRRLRIYAARVIALECVVLAGYGHILEAVVRQTVNQEATDVVAPCRGGAQIGDKHQWCVIQER